MQQQTVEEIVNDKKQSNPVLLKELANRGIDNSKPRDIDHTLLAFSESDEIAACDELEKMGFSVKTVDDDDDDDGEGLGLGDDDDDVDDVGLDDDDDDEEDHFVIEATIYQSPTEAASEEFVTKLAALCVKHNLEYDGWGTSLDQ